MSNSLDVLITTNSEKLLAWDKVMILFLQGLHSFLTCDTAKLRNDCRDWALWNVTLTSSSMKCRIAELFVYWINTHLTERIVQFKN